MTRLKVSKAREDFPEIVRRVARRKERTIVSSGGKDLAAIVPMQDLRKLQRLTQQEMDRQDVETARASLAEAKQKGTTPLRDFMREVGM